MKTLILKEKELIKMQELIKSFDDLYEIENWTIEDLDEFRIIGTEIIKILKNN